MQLIIAFSSQFLHNVILKNTHVLLLQGRTPNRRTSTIKMLYLPEKSHISMRDVPYTSESIGFMQFNETQQNGLKQHFLCDFGRLYRNEADEDDFEQIPGPWVEFDENAAITDSSRDMIDILRRLELNSSLYKEAVVLTPFSYNWTFAFSSQLLHRYMKFNAPIFFATYKEEDDRFAAAFARRHENEWTQDSIANLKAKRVELRRLSSHWFRENSYVVFHRLLMDATRHQVSEPKALTGLSLQILFYLDRFPALTLESITSQVDFTNDASQSLSSRLPSDFSLQDCVNELMAAGFVSMCCPGHSVTLSEMGELFMEELFDNNMKTRHLAYRLRNKQKLGLVEVSPGGGFRPTEAGIVFHSFVEKLKNKTGIIEVMQCIEAISSRNNRYLTPVADIDAELHKMRPVSQSDVRDALHLLMFNDVVRKCETTKLYSLSESGREFIKLIHPRTLDPAAYGRMNRWVDELDIESIRRYINTMFGRQLAYSQRLRKAPNK